MSFNYIALSDRLKRTVNRTDSDLDPVIADAIGEADVEIHRLLRIPPMERTESFVLDSLSNGRRFLPRDYLETIDYTLGGQLIDYVPPAVWRPVPPSWPPTVYTRRNEMHVFAPWQSARSNVANGEHRYYASFSRLTADRRESPMLANCWDAYHAAAMCSLLRHFMFDERVPVWENQLAKHVQLIQTQANRDKFTGPDRQRAFIADI